ncbi:MAG: type II secretion system F family protein [Candidatus Bathyarchaeia archaeon]
MLMFRVSKFEKKIVWVTSAIIGVSLIITTVLSVFYFKIKLIFRPDELMFIAMIVALFPPAVVNFLDARWKNDVDNNIPKMLKELAEAGRTGITLIRALEFASERRYGALSTELKRIVNQISWGASLEEALKSFSDRVETKLAKRIAVLLTEIHKVGGEVQEVLETVSRHINELQTIEKERQSQMKPYIAIVYIAFFVFILIDILLIRSFFWELASLQETLQSAGGFFMGGAIDLTQVETILFHLSLIEGFYAGLVAGKMGEGSIGAGLKHSVILMVTGFIAFFFFVWNPIF